MAPKKSVPQPQSDESDSDMDVPDVVRKAQKKPQKSGKSAKNEQQKGDEPGENAPNKNNDGSDEEDDETDLFALQLPERPEFLTKPNNSNRLMIVNVEVENFKSYFGKASIGPFHKSFTSIIGPNGSGKSNLIDALLFVFGFRAAKIRSAKVANLIHKSKNREPESCTVTIYFQRIIDMPNQTYVVVDDSKFTISRSAFRNSSSSYAINGRPASKTEVEKKLRSVDIDIEHNRFLILQGEVEQIAMMKPVKSVKSETGMIEYLEDIIGSNRLEKFVKLFQRRVNRLTVEQSQQRVTREHARNSKCAMEPQVRDAVEFLSKENEITTLKMKLAQRRRMRYLDKAAPLQAEIDAKIEQKNEVAKKLDSNRKQNEETDELDKKLTKEKAQLDKEIDKLTKELNDLNSEETRRRDTLKRYEADIQKMEGEKEKEEKKKKQLESVPEKAEKKIEKWKEEITTLQEVEETANAKADENLTEFGKETEQPKEEQKKIQEKWAEMNTRLNKIRGEASVAREELNDLKKAAGAGTKKVDDLKARLEGSIEKHEKDKKDHEVTKKEWEITEEKLKKYNEEQPVIREKSRTMQQDLARKKERLDNLRQQNASSASTNKVVNELMKEKAAGRIPSFIGCLGDLGCIDPKYDAAMSSNFRSRLEYLIVGKEEDSPKIIEFLRKNKLRRHTIQPLDRVNVDPNHLKPVPSDRYPAPRLIDLIDCEPEIRPVFYDFLYETIVANSTQDAQRMHKMPVCRGIPIVTLEGSMISSNGNFSGGGQPVRGFIITDKRKKAKQVSTADIEEEKALAGIIDSLADETAAARQKESEHDHESCECRRRHAILTSQLKALTSTITSEAQAIETLKKTIEKQEEEAKKVRVNQAEIDEKEKIVEELEKNRDELAEKTESVKSRQAEIQSKLDGLFKELVQCHRDEAQDAKSKRIKLEKDMAKETANITNSSRNIAKCEENLVRLERDIAKKQESCEKLKEKEQDGEVVEEKKKAVEERESKRKELEVEYEEMSKKRTALTAEELELEDQLKVFNEEVMEAKRLMQDQTLRVKDIEKELDKMRLNRVPKFQFLSTNKPEDMELVFDQEPDENQSPEEVEKQKRHMAYKLTDVAYAMELELRKKVLENVETYDNVDGDKLIPVNLLSDEDVRAISKRDAEQLQFNLKTAETALDVMKNRVDVSCIATYITKVEQFNRETAKVAFVTEELRKHQKELQRIKQMRLEEFHSAFEFIGKHLVAVYKMLTDGGDAKLEYIDKDDPFTQGISFMVRPAKKAWKQIQYLSGGEKTLSSLALIFALHMFRPTPFYVMDEIDAALDYRNVSIIGQYVRQKTENAQFIIISLRNNMFELANRLIGIYKVDGCTQNVAIDPLAVCHTAKLISESLGQHAATTPEEVTANFNETMNRHHKELTSKEKQYANFPSSSEISMAEKIVSVEGRVRKELNNTTAGPSRPPTKASERPPSTRPESRANLIKMPAPRLVPRGSTAASSAAPVTSSATSVTPSRSARNRRNTESDETTPPTKRSNSVNSSPRKSTGSGGSNEKNQNVSTSSREENQDE